MPFKCVCHYAAELLPEPRPISKFHTFYYLTYHTQILINSIKSCWYGHWLGRTSANRESQSYRQPSHVSKDITIIKVFKKYSTITRKKNKINNNETKDCVFTVTSVFSSEIQVWVNKWNALFLISKILFFLILFSATFFAFKSQMQGVFFVR